MRYFAEKEAEKFLKKQGFEVVEGYFVSSVAGMKSALKKVGLPCFIKISGKNIVHKKKFGGVKFVRTLSEAISVMKNFKKRKGVEGVIVQENFPGMEFLLGVKKTPEFEHVVVFGTGGSKVEKEKDVSFRVCPLNKKEINLMFKETKIAKNISKKLRFCLQENVLKLCDLVQKYPRISELDINPFVFSRGYGKVVDARIVWV